MYYKCNIYVTLVVLRNLDDLQFQGSNHNDTTTKKRVKNASQASKSTLRACIVGPKSFGFKEKSQSPDDTVDGRNPAPVDMVNIPLFIGSYTSQVVSRISSINGI